MAPFYRRFKPGYKHRIQDDRPKDIEESARRLTGLDGRVERYKQAYARDQRRTMHHPAGGYPQQPQREPYVLPYQQQIYQPVEHLYRPDEHQPYQPATRADDLQAKCHLVQRSRRNLPEDVTTLRREMMEHRKVSEDFARGYQLARDIITARGLTGQHFTNSKDAFKAAMQSRRNVERFIQGRAVGNGSHGDMSNADLPSRRPLDQRLWDGLALARDHMTPHQRKAIDDFIEDRLEGRMAMNGLTWPDKPWDELFGRR